MQPIKIIIILFVSLFAHQIFGQPALEPKVKKYGKCYADCFLYDLYEAEEIELPVYTGENKLYRDKNLEQIELIVGVRYEFQDKRKNLSSSPTWCRVQVIDTEHFLIVKDTFLTEDYVVEKILIQTLVEERGYREEREILCSGYVDEEFVESLQWGLTEKGYYVGAIDGEYSEAVIKALGEFKNDHHLPHWVLDFETLEMLGIEMDE